MFNKGKRKIKSWLLVVAALAVVALVIFGWAYAEFSGALKSGDTCYVTIKQGSSVSSIAAELKKVGAIDSELLFRVYSKFAKTETLYKYGSYEFENNIGYKEIAKHLINEGERAKTVTVVIPEGTGIYDYTKDVNGNDVTVPGIGTLLERAGVCAKQDFYDALDEVSFDSKLLSNANTARAYCPLEGYLFPETYDLYVGNSKDCAKKAVERMLGETEKRITDDMYKRAEEMGYKMNEILTMASIIQMESGQNAKEMPNVAAVFYNRLKSDAFSTLGSSPTCYYGTFYKGNDGRYDTYKVAGFPPGPLCSPGIDAINAALYPTENTAYYYFVTDSKGKFYFHKTGAEQDATINRLQKEGNWIYEYFN